MNFPIGNYTFQGPFKSTDQFDNQAGVFAIICEKDKNVYLVDIIEASKIRTVVEDHARIDMWNQYCDGILYYACHYTGEKRQPERLTIEAEIRKEYQSPLK